MNKKIRNIIVTLSLGFSVTGLASSLTVPDNLTALDSEKGQKFFTNSSYKQDYWRLSEVFETQKNLQYSGIASIAMILNALDTVPPNDPVHAPYKMFTQDNVFSQAALKIVTPGQIAEHGTSLKTIDKILGTYPVKTTRQYTSDTDYKKFKDQVKTVLNSGDTYVLVNYDRSVLGQEGHGHISPIAAYDEKTNKFLILDVARYAYPPVWVNGVDLWHAMQTIDKQSHHYRGFIIVEQL